jgi:hypothetical protein
MKLKCLNSSVVFKAAMPENSVFKGLPENRLEYHTLYVGVGGSIPSWGTKICGGILCRILDNLSRGVRRTGLTALNS